LPTEARATNLLQFFHIPSADGRQDLAMAEILVAGSGIR
jgi:hypothetical protein